MVKCISIFSGAGGLDVGALNAGADIVACVENDHDAAETLRLNQGQLKGEIFEKNIQDVDFKQWLGLKNLVLIGGPPCQPFSKNGYWVKNDNRLIQDDPRNLLGQYLRALSEMRPKGFRHETPNLQVSIFLQCAVDGRGFLAPHYARHVLALMSFCCPYQ